MEYTISLVFSSDGGELLMQMKNAGPDAGKFSGLENTVVYYSPADAAAMSIREKAGVTVDSSRLDWLATIKVPSSEKNFDTGICDTIHYFATVVDKDKVTLQPDAGMPVTWMPPKKLDSEAELFVGMGNLQYITHMAMKLFGFDKPRRTHIAFKPSRPY